MMDFEWLLAPLSPEDFVREYWGERVLRVRREEPRRYADLLPEDQVEFLVSTAARTPGAVEILSEDDFPRRVRAHSQAMDAFRKGSSIRIDGMQRFSYQVTRLARSLEAYTGCPVNVNMYLTPGAGKKALRRHYDTHDVFVLQIHGNKVWRLYAAPEAAPLEYLPLMRRESLREMKQQRLKNDMSGRDVCILSEEFTLLSGDMLYLPRGIWHEAESRPDEISCHLTVGVQATTYLDLFNVALSQVALANREFRKNLPFGFAKDPLAQQRAAQVAAELGASLAEELRPLPALETLASNFLRLPRAALDQLLLRPESLRDGHLTPQTVVCVRAGLTCGVVTGSTATELLFGMHALAIPEGYEEACRFLSMGQPFKVADLPGTLSLQEKIDLVEQLCREGLLRVLENLSPLAEQTHADAWLPVRVTPDATEIEWMDVGTRELKEPFFHQSVKRLRRQGRATRVLSRSKTPASRPAAPPAGFIFHISRCGSTLLSNGVRALKNVSVISEAQPINAALSLKARSLETGEDSRAEELLGEMMNAYSQHRGQEGPVVYKFSSWNLLHLAWLREMWPEVPFVVLIRDPLEVAVSCLESPPGWMMWKERNAPANVKAYVWFNDAANGSEVEFCARMLGLFLENAESSLNHRSMVLDYSQLDEAAIYRVADHFGIPYDERGMDNVRRTLQVYSKDSRAMRPFEKDSAEKRARGSEELEAAINRWARPTYQNLRSTDGN